MVLKSNHIYFNNKLEIIKVCIRKVDLDTICCFEENNINRFDCKSVLFTAKQTHNNFNKKPTL